MSSSTMLDILVTSSINSFGTQRRFPVDITVAELKQKLELLTGGSASTMELQLLDEKNEVIGRLLNDASALSTYAIANAKVLHVVDSFHQAGEFEDLSKVKKFELSEDEYSKRGETFRAFKEKLKLGEGDQKSNAEEKIKEEEELVKSIAVGNRCEVRVAGKPGRRGTVMYVGKIDIKPGYWIGVKYDEPLGKNDGSLNGRRYFECLPKYGGFIKPQDITIGDFPEESFEIDEL